MKKTILILGSIFSLNALAFSADVSLSQSRELLSNVNYALQLNEKMMSSQSALCKQNLMVHDLSLKDLVNKLELVGAIDSLSSNPFTNEIKENFSQVESNLTISEQEKIILKNFIKIADSSVQDIRTLVETFKKNDNNNLVKIIEESLISCEAILTDLESQKQILLEQKKSFESQKSKN